MLSDVLLRPVAPAKGALVPEACFVYIVAITIAIKARRTAWTQTEKCLDILCGFL